MIFYNVDALKSFINQYIVPNCRKSITATELNTALLGIIQFLGSGGGGDLSNLILSEIPGGVINGSNATFTTSGNFQPGSLQVFVNGLEQTIVDDFNTTGTNTFLLVSSPNVGEHLLVNYIKA